MNFLKIIKLKMVIFKDFFRNKQSTDDCAYTYTSGKIIHLPHVRRINESLELISKFSDPNINRIVDIGGNSGYFGDFLSRNLSNIKHQFIYDIIHPDNERNPKRRFFRPTLKTKYITFNLNNDDMNQLQIDKKTLVICSETLEHIKDPIDSSKKIIDNIELNNSEVYISYPIETGFIGFIKFIQRLTIGRYFRNKRSLNSIMHQIFWLFGFIENFRKIQQVYSDHDGFNDRELTKFILGYTNQKNYFKYLFKGSSTVHFFIKKIK